MPGELPENTWMSEEIVSGMQPCCIAASATVKSKLPPPWPMSNSTPRFFAASASSRSFPSWTMLVNLPALFGAKKRGVRSEEHTSELQSLTNLVCRLLLEKKKDLRVTDRSDCQHRAC